MKWAKRLLIGLLGSLGLLFLGVVLLYWWGGRAQLPEDQYVTSYTVSEKISQDPDSLVVVTFNLGWMSGMTNNLPMLRTDSLYGAHFQRAVDVMQAIRPAILGLQEVDYESRRSRYWHQSDSLAEALRLAYRANSVNWDKRFVPFPYWPPIFQFGPMLSGQSTLSQLPIVYHHREVLPMPPSSFLYTRFYIDRLIQTTILDWQDTTIAFLNVHLEAWHQPTRMQQAERLSQVADSLRHHHLVLLVGDFNAEPPQRWSAHSGNYDSTLVPILDRGFEAATFTAAQKDNWKNSFSSVEPTVSIDHLFYHPAQWECSFSRVITEMGDVSDHLPVVGVFRMHSKAPLQAGEDQVDAGAKSTIPLIE